MSSSKQHLRNMLLQVKQVIRSTPLRSDGAAARRTQGGVMDAMEEEDDVVVTNNMMLDNNVTTERHRGGTVVDLTETIIPQRRSGRSDNAVGTSTYDVSRSTPIYFVNTEQVEDNEAPIPSSNLFREETVNDPIPTSNRFSSGASSRTDLLSAKSTSSSTQSLSWGETSSFSQGRNKFCVFEMPSDAFEFSLICKKKIGHGTTMCVKKRCTINHRGVEIANIQRGVILVQKNADTVFLEPSTERTNVTSEVLFQWMSSRRRLSEWAMVFSLANASEAHDILSPDDLMQGTAYVDLVKNHKSPGMLRARRFEQATDTYSIAVGLQNNSSSLAGEFSEFGKKRSYSDDELTEGNKEARRKYSDEVSVTNEPEKISKFKEAIDHIFKTLELLIAKLDQKDGRFTEEVKILFSRIELLQTDLGTRSTNRVDNLEVPTMWGSIAVLAGTIDEIQKDLNSLPTTYSMTQLLQKDLERIEAKTNETVDLILVDLQQRVSEYLTQRGRTQKDAEDELERVKVKIDASQLAQTETDEFILDLAQGAVVLKDELEDVRNSMRNMSGKNLSNNVNSGSNCSNYVPIPTYDGKMRLVDYELQDLREKILKVENDADGDAVKAFGLGFKEKRSSEEWVDLNLDKVPFGLVLDAHLLLENLHSMSSDNENTIKTLHSMQKLNLTNMSEGICIQSFETRLPKMFARSTNNQGPAAKGKGISHFDKVATYADWDRKPFGTKEILHDNLRSFERSHQDQIDSATLPDSKGRIVATQSLQLSSAWILKFISFIDDTYQSFIKQHTFTEEKAWELTTQLGRRIFLEIAAPRSGIITAVRIGVDAQEQISKLVFWPIIRCHDIMKSFKDANFCDHPAIAGEYVKYLTANSGYEVIARLVGKIDALKEELSQALKASKQAEKQATSAMNAVDEIKKKFSDKITELERHVAHVQELIILGHESETALLLLFSSSEQELLAMLLDPFLKQDKLLFSVDCHVTQAPTHLLLLSGSLYPYLLNRLEDWDDHQVFGVVDAHYSGRLRNGRPTAKNTDDAHRLSALQGVRWLRLRHSIFAGATEFVILVAQSKCFESPLPSGLQRGIRHFLDAGIRPGPPPSDLPIVRNGHHYRIDDRLIPGLYHLPLLCPTYFHASGMGYRLLTSSELASVHGFPRKYIVTPFPSQLLETPPCQLLVALVDTAWNALAATAPVTPRPELNTSQIKMPKETHTYLPELKKYLSHEWIDLSLITSTASKADDAESPCRLWDARLEFLFPGCTAKLAMLRNGMLLWMRRRLWRELRLYLKVTFGVDWAFTLCRLRRQARQFDSVGSLTEHTGGDLLLDEADKASDVLFRLCWSSWWEWDVGSALYFWRWGENKVLARDGMFPFVSSELPKNTRRGNSLNRNEHIEKITDKLSTILKRGYIKPGHVESLIDFFAVPKGDDIRLVYNGTSCGLNEATWAPNFWLPYPRTAIRLLDYAYYSVDVDLGEMFLNFPLHKSMQPASGINLTPFKEKLGVGNGDKDVWYSWTRNWMGARMSPYSSVQFCSIAEEFCRGNNLDADNGLRWDIIVLNLPGSKKYDPSKPRVYKWDRSMGCLAGELVIFVDDCRVTAITIELAWRIARQVCSRFQYLGIQDATRKRKPPTQTPGAWAGAVFATTDDKVTKTVTVEKWNKAKKIVESLNSNILEGGSNPSLGYKVLEVARGFLCHLSMTYEVLVPFLKGFHLALASHHEQRDDNGWKLSDKAWEAFVIENYENQDLNEDPFLHQDGDSKDGGSDGAAPEFVKVTQHLRDDLTALSTFLATETPPIINDRSALVQVVRYGFGDASGTGFGSTIETGEGLKYRVGVWGTDEETESSNYKELENVVSTIEDEAASGNLKGSALFFFTDNSTVEAALFKGNSSSRKLFNLVVRFRRIQLEFGMQVTVSHVSGKRMIQQGTDGVSRGNMKEGVGAGMDMIQFIPLHLSALERHEGCIDWIRDWAGNALEILTPYDWFTRGHDHCGGERDKLGFWRIKTKPGIFLWAPPPAAAEAAIEQLRRALIKRQRSTHIFVCPRLLTTEWLKQLNKAADLIVSLPAGRDELGWPSHMYEPLTIAFIFPFLSHKPWKRRRTPKMYDVARALLRMWKDGEVDSRTFLRKFFKTQLQLTDLPERLTTPGIHDTRDGDRLQHVWGKRQASITAFHVARDGDHLMIPFECDTCIFWKLRGTEPNPEGSLQDRMLLACIRRVNLDAFWSRMSSTVTTNRDKVKAAVKLSESVGLSGPYMVTESFPRWDHCGYEVAIEMVLASLKPGRYSTLYTQWDTIRKLRTAFSNHYRASAQANSVELALTDDRGHSQRISSDPCSSVWFCRFFIGCKRRMGQDWRPNKAMSIHLILKIIRRTHSRMDDAENEREMERWLTFGAYLVIAYSLSLRGVEGLLVDLEGMISHVNRGDSRYFVVALLGKIKGEHQGRCHLLPCIKVTSSGIGVYSWVARLMEEKRRRGFEDGPLFSDWDGRVLTTDALDKMLVEILEELFEDLPSLFPPSIRGKEDIPDAYQVYRSIRRSSDSRALEKKVSEGDIDIVNRWHKVEKAQGSRPTLPMKHHYAQVEILLEPFLRYTYAM